MLCRSEKSLKVSGNGHLKKLAQTAFKVGLAGLLARFGLCVLLGLAGTAQAQNTNNAYNPGQAKIDAQLKPWLANIERVNDASITVSLLDYRLKIEPCEKPIAFDFPFASHKTVRARCEAPAWQYYLQVSTSQPGTSVNAANTSVSPVNAGNPASSQTSASVSAPAAASTGPANAVPSKTIVSATGAESSGLKNVQTDPPAARAGTQNTMNSGFHTVLTSTQFLKRGTILDPSMFVGTEVALQPSEMAALSNPKDVANMELLRDLPANTPLKSFDLKPMVMIKRGQQVIVSIGEGKGFLISIRAESLQDGQLGDQIKLKNTESGRSISAVVTGVNTAKAM